MPVHTGERIRDRSVLNAFSEQAYEAARSPDLLVRGRVGNLPRACRARTQQDGARGRSVAPITSISVIR